MVTWGPLSGLCSATGQSPMLRVHTQARASTHPPSPPVLGRAVTQERERLGGRNTGTQAGHGCQSYNSWQQKPFWES